MHRQTLVRLLVIVLCACTAAESAPRTIDGWVIDRGGPVTGAEVRVVALAPAPCPCGEQTTDASRGGNEVPACSCPAALASWRQRLARCTWPTSAKLLLRSDARGRFAFDPQAHGTLIEASTPSGVQWLRVPANVDRIGVELGAPRRPRFTVDRAVELRAALLYEDGHCVPFQRQGGTTWVTVAPVPAMDEWPVLAVEAKGFAPLVRAWYESGDAPVALELRSTRAASEEEDDTVTIDGGVVSDAPCHDVVVVDRAGKPIADASVRHEEPLRPGMFSSSTGGIAETDRHGKACVEGVYAGGELVAHLPDERGGWCAGEARVKVTQVMLARPIRIRLAAKALQRATWRGRIVTPEKLPVVGAYVAVRTIEPSDTPGCSTSPGVAVRTAIDGTFELALPRGTLHVDVDHDWYAKRSLTVQLPGPIAEIVVDRGGTFSGRVLDPDGNNIDRCELFLDASDGRLLTASCSQTGFAFTTLTPGDAKLKVRVQKHALGTFRTLERTIKIAGAVHVEDVRWPQGESIAGRVVDDTGAPIAGARLTALPKGTRELGDRFHRDEVMLEADGQGRFELRHLAPGTWTIRADRRAGKQVTVDVMTGTRGLTIQTSR